MRWIGRVAAMALVIGFIAGGSGCESVNGGTTGAGGVAYVEGASTAIVKADPSAVLAASKKAFDDLDIYVTSTQTGQTTAELDGKTSNDTSISVSVEKRGKGVSKVWVRVGIFGDRELSNTIFEHIQKHLSD